MRSLERGLAVLLALNRLRSASVLELAAATSLPRPTIYRLLATLQAAGLVARNGIAEQYRLTQRVRTLSDGYDEEEWISAVARPVLEELGREVVWPLSLFTFDAGRMLVRETTHHQSALSIDRGMVGQRLPMLKSAAGRAYLAFCPEKERNAIVLLLAHSEHPDDRAIRDPRRIASVLRDVREAGFATQMREINPKTAGISVPILDGAGVLGCISVIWIASALSLEQAVRRHVAPLREAAARIALASPLPQGEGEEQTRNAKRHGGATPGRLASAGPLRTALSVEMHAAGLSELQPGGTRRLLRPARLGEGRRRRDRAPRFR